MSSQKNNIKDFVKKALVSTSMAATMLTAESAFGTSKLINRDVIGSSADLNSGAGLDAVNNNFTLTAGLTFGNQNSVLQLQTSIGNNGSSTITLGGDINPGAANTGKIEISSVNAGATLTIAGAFNVGIAGGNTVQSIDFSGAGLIVMTQPTLNPTITTPITTSVAVLQLGTVGGGVTYTGPTNLTVNNIAGTTDFAGQTNGALILTEGGSLADVTSSQAAVGTLAIAGSGTIAGTVNNINQIQVNGIGGTTAEFQKNVSVASVLFGNGGTADFKGSLNTDPTGNINFGPNPNGGILQFSGTDPNGYELSSVIENGGNGTLNVYTNLTAIEPSIGTIQTIAIGQVAAPKTLTVDVTKGLLTLLQSPSSTVTFNDPASTLGLTTSINQQVTFNNSFPGIAGGGGIVVLDSQNGTILEIQSSGGTQTLGTSAAPLEQIYVTGNVGVIGTSTNKLDVSNAKNLTIAAGGIFADASPNITSALIPEIFIGDTSGPGVYALDAVNGDFPFAAPGLAFKNDSSVLKLMTSAATGITSTIQLTGDITPPNPNTAIVEINAKNAGSTLVIDGTSNGYSIGTFALPMSKIKFTGDGTIEVTAISTPAIEVSVAKLAIAEVNSDVFFTGPATLAGVQINGDIDFQGNAGTVVLASDTKNNLPALISGNITSTGTQNGTIEFMDDGTIGTVDSNGVSTNTITNIAMLKAGADNSTVTVNSGGDMSIGEIQGTGTGDIVFTQPTNLTGGINLTGGTAVNLTFTGPSSISGALGSNASKVGDITVSNDLLDCQGGVNAGKIILIDGGDIEFDGVANFISINKKVSPNILIDIVPSDSITRFKNSTPITSAGNIGDESDVDILEIAGSDVTILGTVDVGTISFTSTQPVTLSLNNTSIINESVTTTGNGIHTIALAGNTTIGNSDIGGPSNTLKTIQFTKDVTFTDNSPSVYSTVTSNAPNQGTIVFTADNGFTDDLGDSTNSLKTVQFSSVEGTVKGDTYSENVTIDSGKSAIFSGYNSRSTSVPSSTVGGVTVPRSTPQFNYQTVVSSSDFQGTDNTTSAKFTNAALVQAPINNGNLTFEDDVWLQKPVTGTSTITFAPQKNALISAGVGATNIVADQTTMVFVGDNATIPAQGNITGNNITFDLGNNTVVYDGTATPTGNLVFNVLYDTTNAGKTANTNSGNIVLANGAVLDLSKVTSIQVILTAQNNPNGIRLGSAYPLVSSTGGSIIPGAAAKLPFNVIANEKNFVRWVINDDSFILYTATADIIPTISRPSIAIHRIIHSNPNIIIPDIDIINPITNGFTPATPGTGSVTGGVFTPVDPNIPGNNVVVTGNNPVIVNGGNTPSIGSGGNTPNGPVTGGSVIGGVYTPSNPSNSVVPSGPGTGGSTPSIGSGGNTPNGPVTGGSVIGGVYTPSNPSNSVVPSGPGTGGSTPSIGSGGNTPSIVSGGNTPSVRTGGNTPSIGSGGNTPNGPVTGGSVIGGVYTPSNPSNSVVPSGPGTGGSTPSIGSGGNTPSIVSGGNTPSVRTGGNTPSIGSGGNTPNSPITGGSVIGGVYTPSNPSNSVVPSGSGTGGSTPSIGSGGNTPSIGTGGSTGNNPYTPSVGTGGNTGNSPSNYNPSVGTGGNTGNSPSNYNPSVGTGGNTGNSPSNYNPSVGTGGNTGNSPSNYNPSVGTGGSTGNSPSNYNPSVGTRGNTGNSPSNYNPSVGTGGNTGNSPSNYNPSVGTGGNTGNSPSNYNPSVGTGGNTGNSPSNYNPSVGTGGSTGNSPSNYNPSVGTGGSTGNSPSNYNPASGGNIGATGNNAYGGNTGNSLGNYNYNSSAGSNGGVSSTGSSPNGYKSSTGSGYNGSATNGAVGVVPANNASGSTYQPSNNNGSASDISAIGSSRDNQVGAGGSGNGGSSNSGISRSNANDGFNAAKDNASMGNQEINKRMEAVKNADGTSPDSEEADSRKRGAAVGGGDCDDYNTGNVYGVWISPYYGKAVQKALSDGFSGYTAKSEGGSVGVDTVINDNIVLGAAYTRIDTKLRYKDSKSGNVTKVETNMGSVYGLYNFADNLFIEGITTYSRSRIKTNELRGTVDGTENAYGKYNSTSYSAQVVGGYNYLWKDSSLAPMAGLRFTRIKDSGYQEQGTTFQNLTIKKRQYNKVEGILGAEIKTTFYKDDFIIRPQAYAFINYDFSGKTPAIVAELNGINEPLPVQTPKATKMLYDLGAGVVVKKGNMEYGVHYGLNFAKKYHAQSGTLRLKLNF